MVKSEKGVRFRFVTVQNFSIIRIDALRALSVPPHGYVLPKYFNDRTFTEHVNKRFVWKGAVITFWRSFYIHFIQRVISGYDVMYKFKLK